MITWNKLSSTASKKAISLAVNATPKKTSTTKEIAAIMKSHDGVV